MRTLSKQTLKQLESLTMCSGVGDGKETACIAYQQAIANALERGLPKPEPSDDPPCVSPLLRRLEIRANDTSWWASNEERTETLREFVPLLMSTQGSDELEWRRIWRFMDWVLREEYPILFPELSSLKEEPSIVDRKSAKQVLVKARARDLALDRARDLALDLALDLARARALDLASRKRFLSILRELAEMQ